MTAVADVTVITDPGVYTIPDGVYHADPVPQRSLSSSGARKLLPPSCPAKFQHERENRPPSKPHFDMGHAAHKLVLGSGPEIVAVDADDWRTKAAKEARDAAYAEGKTPLLAGDVEIVEAMAQAIRQHPVASALFNPDHGDPEQSLFWTDEPTGTTLRARLDWLPTPRDGRLIIPDYKTTTSALPAAFAKSCANYGYSQQAAWYLDAIRALNLAEESAFVFVAQEKTAPYLVTVIELDADALRIGRALNRLAIDLYADCTANDTWPGYSDDVVHLSLPTWFVRQHDDLLENLA